MAIIAAISRPDRSRARSIGTHSWGRRCRAIAIGLPLGILGGGSSAHASATPTFAEMVTFFGAGMVDVSFLPDTSFIGLYDKDAPVKIVGGAASKAA